MGGTGGLGGGARYIEKQHALDYKLNARAHAAPPPPPPPLLTTCDLRTDAASAAERLEISLLVSSGFMAGNNSTCSG